MTTLYTATLTLILVMDPLGNIPVFLSVLNTVEPARRMQIILRESLIAFIILVLFLFCGNYILDGFGISSPAFSISGGIILFLIALRMIFPAEIEQSHKRQVQEPFIVPLAIPLIAGPSALAIVMVLSNEVPKRMGVWFLALIIASSVVTIILSFSNQLHRILGPKVLMAFERLMGMILTTLAIEMFLRGITEYFKLIP